MAPYGSERSLGDLAFGILGQDIKVRNSPGKGLGVFALRSFVKHEKVFACKSPDDPHIAAGEKALTRMMNNDCIGNCFVRDEWWGADMEVVYAARDIALGEELARPYMENCRFFNTTADTFETLRSDLHFDCSCVIHAHLAPISSWQRGQAWQTEAPGVHAILQDSVVGVIKAFEDATPLTPDAEMVRLSDAMERTLIPKAVRLGFSQFDVFGWEDQMRKGFDRQASPALAYKQLLWARRAMVRYAVIFGQDDQPRTYRLRKDVAYALEKAEICQKLPRCA